MNSRAFLVLMDLVCETLWSISVQVWRPYQTTTLICFKLIAFGPAASSVALGIAALTATGLVAGLGNFVSKIFTDSNEPSVFERIGKDLEILSSLDISNLAGFDALSKSLFQLGDGIDKIA